MTTKLEAIYPEQYNTKKNQAVMKLFPILYLSA